MKKRFPEEKMEIAKNNMATHTNLQNGKNKITGVILYQSEW